MSEQKTIETLNIGIVGHIDHGKTTLLYKLSKRWTDTHSEEMKRGITIRLGYADITIYEHNGVYGIEKEGKPVRHVSFIDAPGHEMLMSTTLAGAALIDAAILVVAANEGIKPQTREHVIALQAKKVKHLIVVQNKVDLVTKEQALKNYKDIQSFLKGRFDKASIIPVSAQQDVNIDKVYAALCEVPLPARDAQGAPIFIVARSFDVNRPGTQPAQLHGTILGGTLKHGTVHVGDKLEIKPGVLVKEANQYHYHTLMCTVKKLFRGSQDVDALTPGGSMSIETSLDMAFGKADALSGCVASSVGTLPALADTIKVSYTLFPEVFGASAPTKAEPLKASEMLMLSINTSKSVGMVKRMHGTEAELTLKIPVVALKGDTVALARNINNHWRLIGYGEIL